MLAEEEDEEDVGAWAGLEGSVPKPPRHDEVQRCPHCRVAELIWDVDGVPRCERHGVVDLSKPEPVEGTCVGCGGEVLWEMDAAAPGGFAAICEECGPTQVNPPKERQQREDRWTTFA
jgi:hypothetical protein